MLNSPSLESQALTLLGLLRQDGLASPSPTLGSAGWLSLADLAARQSLAPLLYSNLVKANLLPNLPHELAQDLKTVYFRSLKNNTLLYAELEKLLREFNQAAIPVILLKGAYLAEFVYPNIALRPMVDLDLLVHRGDLQRALDIQNRLGYTGASDQLVQAEIDLLQHVPGTFNGDIKTELHWTLAHPESGLSIDVQALWQCAQPLVLNGILVCALSLEDQILHLCIHASYQHFFECQGRALLDLNEILIQKGGQVQWPLLAARAADWHAARGVFLMLHLAREYLGAPVPDEILTQLRPMDFSPSVIQNALHLFVSGRQPIRPRFTQLVSGPGLRAKAQAFRQAILPARAEVGRQYKVPSNSWRVWFYYPRMLFERLSRHWRTLGKLARGDPSTDRQFRDTYAMRAWLNGSPPRPR